MSAMNPYNIQAGPELDRLIHVRVMGQPEGDAPAYSSDETLARRVLGRLKADSGRTVVVGRTALRRGRRYFARYETDPSDGTEVLAETLSLAICRLALLRTLKREEAIQGDGP